MLGDARALRDTTEPVRGLAAGFFALTAATFGLIVLGALVRAHEAGLACPDWPLCFGEFVPQINLQVGFEYAHRVYAGTIALCFAGLGFLAWRRAPEAGAIRKLVGLGAALLVVQILLGALTVWLLLASWTVTAHLVTGNTFAVILLLLGCELRERAEPVARAPLGGSARLWCVAVAVLLFFQMVLGGLVSSQYAGMACPEWPTCNGGLWFPSFRGSVGLHLLHRTNGYALLGALVVAFFATRRAPRLARFVGLAAAIGICQVLVGIANVLLAIPVEVTGLHSALAAALVLTTALAVREVALARAA